MDENRKVVCRAKQEPDRMVSDQKNEHSVSNPPEKEMELYIKLHIANHRPG